MNENSFQQPVGQPEDEPELTALGDTADPNAEPTDAGGKRQTRRGAHRRPDWWRRLMMATRRTGRRP
jgi:hypothetical protein